MRIGDLDAAVQEVSEKIAFCEINKLGNELTLLLQVRDAVMDCPTIDAVPVVRCKDCDHRTHDGAGKPYCLALEMYLNKELDFFCSYGERKDGGE